jgi:isopropylmalate/homocitrate/citramalate synthase
MARNSSSVSIFEVGPRDGLQNEKRVVSTRQKLQFIDGLVQAGFKDLELGAFVRPDKVPQMADTDAVYRLIRAGKLKLGNARAWALVPNKRGLDRALKAGVTHIAVFTAATESFTKKNIGMSIERSLAEFKTVITDGRKALGDRFKIRAYVSTAFGCPFEGKTPPKAALNVIEKLADLGVDQISIGDTIGVATPNDVHALIKPAIKMLGVKRTAVHFHDTRGTAIANALRAYELGVRVFDSSAGGLGGCPFAPGAAGNLATEDLLYMMTGMGIDHGIDLDRLAQVSLNLNAVMKRPIASRYLQSLASTSN